MKHVTATLLMAALLAGCAKDDPAIVATITATCERCEIRYLDVWEYKSTTIA